MAFFGHGPAPFSCPSAAFMAFFGHDPNALHSLATHDPPSTSVPISIPTGKKENNFVFYVFRHIVPTVVLLLPILLHQVQKKDLCGRRTTSGKF